MNRLNHPKEYISWLKKQPIFSNGELDNLPKVVFIIHDSLIIEHLALLGYGPREYFEYKIGSTDPISFFKVRDSQKKFEFLLMGGLPGIGGITTQMSELAALGVKYAVHIGTCGLVGQLVNEGTIILSSGSYCGDGSNLLSGNNSFTAKPNIELYDQALKYFNDKEIKTSIGYGFTTPIFYNQPERMIRDILDGNTNFEGKKIGFVEMEQGGFFNTCNLLNVQSISLVTGSDRYVIESGKVNQIYYDHDVNETKLNILSSVIDMFSRKENYAQQSV